METKIIYFVHGTTSDNIEENVVVGIKLSLQI